MAAVCLVLALHPILRLGVVEGWPITEMSVDGVAYHPVGPEWSGFYDWLRDQSGNVIGVRYHPTEDTRFVLEEAKDFDYISIGEYNDLSIFFSRERAFDPEQSSDQDFLYDQVFVPNTGHGCVVSFAGDDLPENQLVRLKQLVERLNLTALYSSRNVQLMIIPFDKSK